MSHNGWELNPIPERSDQKAALTLPYHSGIQRLTSEVQLDFLPIQPWRSPEFAHRGADSDAVFGFWGAYERRFRRDAA